MSVKWKKYFPNSAGSKVVETLYISQSSKQTFSDMKQYLRE